MEILHQTLGRLFHLSRLQKQTLMFVFDILAVIVSAFVTRWVIDQELFSVSSLLITIVLSLVINTILRFYNSVTRHISLNILFIAALSALIAGIVFSFSSVLINAQELSIKALVIFSLVLYTLISGSRLLVRSYFTFRNSSLKENIIIYGAGAAGQQLAASLINGNEFNPIAFIDDNRKFQSTYINDIRVSMFDELSSIIERHKPQKIFLALPGISRRRRQEIISKLEPLPIEVQSIPGMADIISGKMAIDQIQDVSIDDLLGRDAVPPKPGLFGANIKDKTVLVTGAGGSIGSELCRQIFKQGPKELLLFEVSEYSLYAINREIELFSKELNQKTKIIPLLGSVQDRKRIDSILDSFKVDTIYHAAAYKHVPLVEYNIVQGIENNIFGTKVVADSAIAHSVDTFVLVSTDKAVRPTNVMGTTKRFAELVLQALANAQSTTRFCMVRFGNVLGSSGSVVPLFKSQIRAGGPITVTHKDITRYFMTIPEAAQLVIQAGAMGKGGDVFVLDMGDSIKIADLAKKMVRLMGLEVRSEDNPDGDIEIVFTGLRPGEKLYEELLVGSNVKGTEHPRIMAADEEFLSNDILIQRLDDIKLACANLDFNLIRQHLLLSPSGYRPTSEICDYLHSTTYSKKSTDSGIVINFHKPS